MKLSAIVPTLDERQRLESTLRRARQVGVDEIVVVDGGSTDGTPELAQAHADTVIVSPPGRARQMNAGARVAHGEVFLFLHADTLLPANAGSAVRRALADPLVAGGRFDVDLAPSSPLLGLVAALMNVRSRLSGIATGDQALFVRREVFDQLGGYADIPLMEDIEFSRRLKRAGRLACLHDRVATSSRRWLVDGPVRTILRMWTLRLLYFLGVPPSRLRRVYADRR